MTKQKMKDLVIGKWYYTYDDDKSLKAVRIKKIYNSQKIAVESKDSNGKYSTHMLTQDDLKNYRGIKPDYLIAISVVKNKLSDLSDEDIIVCMFKEINGVPLVVCRQYVATELGELSPDGKVHLGTCVSVDAFKDQQNKYAAFLAMDGIVEYTIINGYMNDTPDNILRFMNIKTNLKTEEVLKSIHDKYCNQFSGLASSVDELLKMNNFWNEVDRWMNIVNVNFEIKHNTIEEEQLVMLENYTHHAMTNIDIVEYHKDINLDDIKTDYMLVRDKTGVVYLINYIKGEFILDNEAMSEEEFQKFTKLGKK